MLVRERERERERECVCLCARLCTFVGKKGEDTDDKERETENNFVFCTCDVFNRPPEKDRALSLSMPRRTVTLIFNQDKNLSKQQQLKRQYKNKQLTFSLRAISVSNCTNCWSKCNITSS